MKQAFVCLGSNTLDAATQLAKARNAIGRLSGVALAASSSMYSTEPQGRKDQPWFLNQVLQLECSEEMEAVILLDAMLALEDAMGRVRDPNDRFGPRVIDIDLLLFAHEKSDDPHVTLPHPRMKERAFVLVPLSELVPDLLFPDGENIVEALQKLTYHLDGSSIFQ